MPKIELDLLLLKRIENIQGKILGFECKIRLNNKLLVKRYKVKSERRNCKISKGTPCLKVGELAVEIEEVSGLSLVELRTERVNSFKYQIMNKDILVAETFSGDIKDWKVFDRALLPSGLQLLNSIEVIKELRKKKNITSKDLREFSDKQRGAWKKVEDNYRSRVYELNTENMQNWLSTRVLPLSRENSKILCQVLGLDQNPSKQYKVEIAIRFMAVSITDNYWVRKSTASSIKWSEVDVRSIPLHDNLGLFALTGDSDFTIDSVTDIQSAAEISLIGTYPKGCMRRGGRLFVVKGGPRRDVIVEWLSSKILGCTNVYGYCKYFIDDGLGKNGFPVTNVFTTFCEVMSNLDRDLVMAVTMPKDDAESIATMKFPKQYAQIAVWDYLCGNTDRHSGNWGFFREAPTWGLTGLHDIYDNNKAFNVATYKPSGRNIRGSIVRHGFEDAKTLEQGALIYKEIADFKFIKSVHEDWFKQLGQGWTDILSEFIDRCKFLDIDVTVV